MDFSLVINNTTGIMYQLKKLVDATIWFYVFQWLLHLVGMVCLASLSAYDLKAPSQQCVS